MHQDPIIVSVEQAVAIVTINRVPQRNALSNAFVGALTSALHRLEVHPSIKVPMLTGQGMHFAAGAEEMHSLTNADVTIRRFKEPDAGPVRALFITVNRLLSPPDMRAAFEDYIALAEEMDRVSAYYTERGGGFWVAIRADTVIGMFGLEPATTDA